MLLSLLVLPCLMSASLFQANQEPSEAPLELSNFNNNPDMDYYLLRMREREGRREAYKSAKAGETTPNVLREKVWQGEVPEA